MRAKKITLLSGSLYFRRGGGVTFGILRYFYPIDMKGATRLANSQCYKIDSKSAEVC